MPTLWVAAGTEIPWPGPGTCSPAPPHPALAHPSCVCTAPAWDLALCPLLPPQVRTQPRSDPDPEPAQRPHRSSAHFGQQRLLPEAPKSAAAPSLEKLEPSAAISPGKLWSRLNSATAPSLGELETQLRLQPSQGSSSSGSQKVGFHWRPRSNPRGPQGASAGRALLGSRRHELKAPSAGVRGELHGTPSAQGQRVCDFCHQWEQMDGGRPLIRRGWGSPILNKNPSD